MQNLAPSMTIKMPRKPKKIGDYVPALCQQTALKRLIDHARREFGFEHSQGYGFNIGFVRAMDDRAYFQVTGDTTPYSILVPDDCSFAIFWTDMTKL